MLEWNLQAMGYRGKRLEPGHQGIGAAWGATRIFAKITAGSMDECMGNGGLGLVGFEEKKTLIMLNSLGSTYFLSFKEEPKSLANE